jgi:4-amino-4-deoxychorismate lyase
MSRLLETLQLKNGTLQNVEYHNRRMISSSRALFDLDKKTDLQNEVTIPPKYRTGIYKCRVVYNENIDTIEFIPYEIRPVLSLKIVHGEIDYSHKFEDRSAIKGLFAKRENCDDILIIKNNIVTDTSYCNIVFYRDGKWFTPSSPLLKGTKREKHLDEGIINAEEITIKDIQHYTKACLINSMLDIGDIVIEIKNII